MAGAQGQSLIIYHKKILKICLSSLCSHTLSTDINAVVLISLLLHQNKFDDC